MRQLHAGESLALSGLSLGSFGAIVGIQLTIMPGPFWDDIALLLEAILLVLVFVFSDLWLSRRLSPNYRNSPSE